MPETALPKAENGGFPQPPANSAVRLIQARHENCGETTRVRLMAAIPAATVHRMHCARCAEDFRPPQVEDLGMETAQVPARRFTLRKPTFTPRKRTMREPIPETSLPKAENGGFPQPPANSAVRLIQARHDDCGETTRVRLMAAIPAATVHRMHCARCAEDFRPPQIEDLGMETAQIRARRFALRKPSLRLRKPDFTLPRPRFTLRKPSLGQRKPDGTPPKARFTLRKPAFTLPKPNFTLRKPTVTLPKPTVTLPKPNFTLRKPAVTLPRPRLSLPKPRVSLPKLTLPRLNPQGRLWQLASVPLGVLAMIAGLALFQNDEGSPPSVAVQSAALDVPAETAPAATGGGATEVTGAKPSKNTELVRGSSYSLALPAGWTRVPAAGGATLAAVAPEGAADATLWIEEDAKLDFPNFISQSLAQLEALTGSARIVARIPAPTPEATVVRLAADTPPDQPSYEVTLRVAGPYRYYLATSVQPGAAPAAIKDTELVVGSLTPEVGGS